MASGTAIVSGVCPTCEFEAIEERMAQTGGFCTCPGCGYGTEMWEKIEYEA